MSMYARASRTAEGKHHPVTPGHPSPSRAGTPLDGTIRSALEAGFGHSLPGIRIHAERDGEIPHAGHTHPDPALST